MNDELTARIPGFLARQRWYAGGEPTVVDVADSEELDDRLEWLLLEADDAQYSLLVGSTKGAVPEFLHGQDAAIIGTSEDVVYYDALLDPDLSKVLLARLAPDEEVTHVRPMGAEQSNTSLVFDERLVMKVFRRVQPGRNPDIEVTSALAEAGFEHIAAPLAAWERNGTHLAVVQPFLAGGIDGWGLALTSLRDLYASECTDPADCGGDFAGEATRLGEVTAKMHLALAGALAAEPADVAQWAGLMQRQLDRIGSGRSWEVAARSVFERLRALDDPGVAIRVHGDYHLGQVLRTDVGWFVLDFEGEPARPIDERRARSSPLKDVAGLLRSFQYAAAVALRERPESEWATHGEFGASWEQRNRNAFLEGYLAADGVAELLSRHLSDTLAALAAWELDKAIYEVGYELDHRPDWVNIPESAIERLT